MTTRVKSAGYESASDNVLQILCKAPDACSNSVTNPTLTESTVSPHDITLAVLPQGLAVIRGLVSAKFSVRVLARLAEAEQKTEVATEQQDYRIAWLTVLRADEGNQDPWRQAFWEVVGNTPEKTIPYWQCKADLMADEYVPLSMIELRYTKDWGGDYIRAKMAADAARAAGLPPKKPVTSLPDFTTVEKVRARRKREQSKGFSVVWPIVFAAAIAVLFLLWLAMKQPTSYLFSAPADTFQVLQQYDAYHYKFNHVGHGPMAVTFCQTYKPQFSAGHTIIWLRYEDRGDCWDIQPKEDGYRLERGPDGKPTLASNCFVNDKDVVECNSTEARF